MAEEVRLKGFLVTVGGETTRAGGLKAGIGGKRRELRAGKLSFHRLGEGDGRGERREIKRQDRQAVRAGERSQRLSGFGPARANDEATGRISQEESREFETDPRGGTSDKMVG